MEGVEGDFGIGGKLYEDDDALNGRFSLSSSPSSGSIGDTVVYKLVRVEGDGTLIPATDDEVMEVEDLLEVDKNQHPVIVEPAYADKCLSVCSDDHSQLKIEHEESGGPVRSDKSDSLDSNTKKRSTKLEYIEDILQKVKEEERLRLSGSCGQSSKYTDTVLGPQDEDGHMPTGLGPSEEPPIKAPNGHFIPDSSILELDLFNNCDEICLDNLSIRELQQTYRATFGRETSVKDKIWLKRRIAMGLMHSIDVPSIGFVIKKMLSPSGLNKDNTDTESSQVIESASRQTNAFTVTWTIRSVGGVAEFRKEINPNESDSEDGPGTEPANKRLRKPTKRYIEELSESGRGDSHEKPISASKIPRRQMSGELFCQGTINSAPGGTGMVTREQSLGGSGVRVPYVSRVRRGRPRKNLLALVKYHSTMAAKLVKKALGVGASQQSYGRKLSKAGVLSGSELQVEAADEVVNTFSIPHFRNGELPLEAERSRADSHESIVTVPTAKGGMRRKHHRAWTLNEVMRLVDGVSKFGAGRWSDIKRLSFASQAYRTSVDLKDKWRNLLKASSQPFGDRLLQTSRNHSSIPIPTSVLVRVRELAARHPQTVLVREGSNITSKSRRDVTRSKA